MKIGYFADGPWSHKALERLLKDGHDICFIVPRFDTQDPVLKKWSGKLDIPFIICENVNDPEFITSIAEFKADLFISMSFNQILKKEILNVPRLKFINCHAGKLPFYRGRNPLNWALINGETSIGVTTHFIDEGIDTGDIITQELIDVSKSDTYKTLLEKAINVCPISISNAVKCLENDSFNPIKQSTIHPVGTYFGQRRVGDEIINWGWDSDRINNFIRAITTPGPGARTYLNGEQEIAILSSKIIENAPNYISTVGEVVGRRSEGVVVKSGDTTILITSIQYISTGQIEMPKFKIGTRLLSMKH